jgi:hypothetical protein
VMSGDWSGSGRRTGRFAVGAGAGGMVGGTVGGDVSNWSEDCRRIRRGPLVGVPVGHWSVVMSADWSEYWLAVMSGDWSGGLVGDWSVQRWALALAETVGDVGQLVGDCRRIRLGTAGREYYLEYWSEYWSVVMSAECRRTGGGSGRRTGRSTVARWRWRNGRRRCWATGRRTFGGCRGTAGKVPGGVLVGVISGDWSWSCRRTG